MKIISKFLFLLLLIFTVSGCGSFFGGNEAVGISSIETEELEDGSIKLIINYTDEEMEPVEIIIPKGEEGAKGNGIKEIKTESGDDVTKVIVTYTDTSMPALEFNVPHGSEIEAILVVDKDDYEIKTDENGNEYRVDADGKSIEEEGKFFEGTKYLKVIYTETESPESEVKKSSKFELPKGVQGEEGNGIEYIKAGKLLDDGTIEEDLLNEDGSITLEIKYTQSSDPQLINIPPNRGISSIEQVDTIFLYGLKIYYTTFDESGLQEYVEYTWNKPTLWLSGDTPPSDIKHGKPGDYYYDTSANKIYFKKTAEGNPLGYWDDIVDFGTNDKPCNIEFNANGGVFREITDTDIKETTIKTVSLQKGEYFYRNEDGKKIPIPVRDGYIFIGWYTSPDLLDPTIGKFTDLTIVNGDIFLYAIWQENK